MKTKENFEGRRLLRERNEKNSKVKKESLEAAVDAGQPALSHMKQEPDDWAGHGDFEWDMDNPNNFLDATLHEETNGSLGDEDDDDSNDEDFDGENYDQNFAPRSGRTSRRGRPKKTPELSQHDLCLAIPDRRLVCQDKASLGADWFEQQRAQLALILSDFDRDLDFFREKMPARLATAEQSVEWSLVVLRSESDTLELGLPGELTCPQCQSDFPSVAKKVEHTLSSHFGDERQFICGICPQYDEIDESSMFSHVSQNHIVVDDNSEKSRFGAREAVFNELDQGPILRNLISAESFTGKFLPLNVGHIFIQ
jgi:transcription elongation factor Elf1